MHWFRRGRQGAVAWPTSNVYDTQTTGADLIRDMRQAGWVLDRVRGSHHVFKHPQRTGIVVVPHPKRDLGAGLVSAIRRQAGI
jgi:predicted RNA binding protein YcfA (HicA-like mRNA interferase family)